MLKSLLKLDIESLYLTNEGVPTFLPIVCNYIKKFKTTVGVFRVSGNHNMIDELILILNCPECAIPPCASVHDVAGFLKLWLINLPEPIITPQIFNEYFIQDDESSIIKILQNIKPINRKILALIFSTLLCILSNSNLNQMPISNLATCFQTSLTQDFLGLNYHFPFPFFLRTSLLYLNQEETEFIF